MADLLRAVEADAEAARRRASLKVWVLKDGEHLPVQEGARPMRAGLLADALVARGHEVVWWSSTFSHQRKSLLYSRDTSVELNPRFLLRLVHGGTYTQNMSVRRYLHHRTIGRRFRRQAESAPAPDVIVTAFPTIDLAYEAVRYAVEHRVPVIVDVRDLWPDIMIEKSRRIVRRPLRWLLAKDFARTDYIFRHADGIVATSRGYLRWGLRHAGRSESCTDRVFYLGSPPAASDDTAERIEALRPRLLGKVVFSFIGSFGNSYELALICEVARRVQTVENVHFVLAGDGQQRAAVAAARDTLSNLTLLDWLTAAESRQLLRSSHVGLVPCISTPDTMPNKVFEYLSAGLPILSSLEGEMEALISKHDVGMSYRCGNADELEALVRGLAADSALRAGLAARAVALYERDFTADGIYGAYCAHVEQVAASARRESLAV